MTVITVNPAHLPLNHQAPPVSMLGNALCNRVECVYKDILTMCTLIQSARNQPCRTTNAVFSLCSGAAMCLAGSFTGAIGVFSGTRDIYNLSRRPKINNVEDVLNGISAGIDAIGIIGKDQEKHLTNIGNNLLLIKQNVNRLHANLDEIHALNKLGLAEVRSSQDKALSLNVQALDAYREANELFVKAQDLSGQARTSFKESERCFTEILEIGRSANPDLDLIKDKAAQAVAFSKEGIAQLDESERIFIEAFAAFHEANTFKTQALTEILMAHEKAKEVMKFSLEKSQYVDEFNSKFAAIEQDLSQAKKDIRDILRLVDTLADQLIEANRAIRGKLDPTDLIAGILGGITAVPLAGGLAAAPLVPVIAVSAGVSAAYGLHYSDRISNTARRIYEYWFGEPQGLGPVTLLKRGEILRARFDTDSSGTWGKRVMKRSSHTTGDILLDLGDITPFVLRFNLNNKYPVSQLDLLNLFKILSQKIGDNSLQPEHCLELLRQLKRANMIQGGDAILERIVIVPKHHVLFRRIKSMCIQKINGL